MILGKLASVSSLEKWGVGFRVVWASWYVCFCVYLTSNTSARQKRFAQSRIEIVLREGKTHRLSLSFVHVSKHSVISLSCLIMLILNRLWFRGKKEHQVFLTVLNHSSWLKKDSLYIQTGLSYLNLHEEKTFILSSGWSLFFCNPS